MNLENKKQFVTLLLAVGLGLVAVFWTSHVIQNSVNKQTAALAQAYDRKSAAQRDELLKEMQMQYRDLNQKLNDVEKRAAMAAAQSSTVQKTPQVVDSTVFAEVTPPGKRALTIQIDSLSAVGGLISPGDHVDIIAHLDMPVYDADVKKARATRADGGSTETVTSVLFQNIQVLAVGSNFKPAGNAMVYQSQQSSRTLNVTLALEPDESGLLTFAQKNGNLQLVLRSQQESDIKVLQVASWDALSDYVLDRQGTELKVPEKKVQFQEETGEVKPFIEIFRKGEEL